MGEIAAMVRLAMGEAGAKQTAAIGDRGLFAGRLLLVAGRGFEPLTFRL